MVGSLWEVDDDATEGLSKLMYAGMKKGTPVAESLSEAQEVLMRKKPHPYFWAALLDSGTAR